MSEEKRVEFTRGDLQFVDCTYASGLREVGVYKQGPLGRIGPIAVISHPAPRRWFVSAHLTREHRTPTLQRALAYVEEKYGNGGVA